MAAEEAIRAAKNAIRKNLKNSDLVEIIANKSKFKKIIIQNEEMMKKVINIVDINTLGNLIGKEKMLNIIVNDKTMLNKAKNKTLTNEQRAERNRLNRIEYERRKNRREQMGRNYQNGLNYYGGFI